MFGIPASLYGPIFRWTVFLLCLIYAFKIYNWDSQKLLSKQSNFIPAVIICVIVALFFGFRPISGSFLGDTVNYARQFYNIAQNPELAFYDLSFEEGHDKWFTILMIYCTQWGEVDIFFTIIAVIYLGCTLWACVRIFPNNPYAAVLITLASFSFYSYGINGIRNGMACSLICVAISYADGKFWSKILAAALCLLAMQFHNSTSLPALMLFVSVFFIRDFRWALNFWILSIFISLFAGNTVADFFESLGFDDRMTKYLKGAEDEEMMESFSNTGFRWDFLLYSCVPIVIGYYIVIKRGIRNKMYELLLNTYTLSNAFWVMVIRAAFSNRFAYLSWFMYPLVLAYPFLKMKVWENQGEKTAWMVMGNILFTMIV